MYSIIRVCSFNLKAIYFPTYSRHSYLTFLIKHSHIHNIILCNSLIVIIDNYTHACTPLLSVPHYTMYPITLCTLLYPVPHCYLYPVTPCNTLHRVPHYTLYSITPCTQLILTSDIFITVIFIFTFSITKVIQRYFPLNCQGL